jgi:hypothetical protein
LRPIQTKIFLPSYPKLALVVFVAERTHPAAPSLRPWESRRSSLVTIEDDTLDFGFAQENVGLSNLSRRQLADGQ